MQRIIRHVLLLLIALPLPVLAIEEPAFKVLKQQDSIEIREYSPYIVAEVEVEAGFVESGNMAFRPLFNFISGNNRAQRKIAMTAPVTQSAVDADAGGTKIEMTAPVTQRADPDKSGAYRVGFVMPAGFTLDTVPQPLDPKVMLREVPGRTVAVIRYSGTWSESRYAEHEALLRTSLPAMGWTAINQPVFARYNGPFTPWFLRRNEIQIEVKPAA